MYYFIVREGPGCSNLLCEGINFADVFVQGLKIISQYHNECGPFFHYVITDGRKGPVVWETKPADVKNKKLFALVKKVHDTQRGFLIRIRSCKECPHRKTGKHGVKFCNYIGDGGAKNEWLKEIGRKNLFKGGFPSWCPLSNA